MQPRRHPLLLDATSGRVMFRGLQPAVVVDVTYDETTNNPADWHHSGTALGGSMSHPARGAHGVTSAELAAALHGPSGRLDRPLGESPRAKHGDAQGNAPVIEVDWDPDEAPTRVCVGGDQLSLWRPSAAEPYEPNSNDAPTERFSPTLPPSLLSLPEPTSAARRAPRRDLPPLPSVLERAPAPAPEFTPSVEQPPAHAPAEAKPEPKPAEAPEGRRYSPSRTLHGETRASRRRWLLPSLGGALIAAVSGSSAYWLFSRPTGSELVVETTPVDAQVALDGKLIPGNVSPYRTRGLAVGQHQLVVRRPGFTPQTQNISVERRDDKRALSVRLAPALKAATLSVSSNPSGAEIFIDGRPTDLTTPAAITDLNLGQHTVALKLDGYADGEQSVRVPEDALVSVTLVKASPEELDEARAAARAAAKEALRLKRSEVRAARVAARYRARMGLPPDPAIMAILEEAGETLEPEPAAASGAIPANAPPAAASPAPPAASTPAPAPNPAPKAAAAPAQPAPALADAQAKEAEQLRESVSETGTLQLTTRPRAEVYVDGEHVGHTPLQALTLPVGRHTLRLENAPMNMSKTVEITISAGRTLNRVEDLAE